MIKTNQHIVAKCSWNTYFDNKVKGTELQNNISSWCQYHFQEILMQVFDEVCPKEKTFKIKRLELNLGEIDYHNFYEELSDKIKRELYKNLQNIVQYPYKYRQGVEVINEKTSHVRALEYFLLNGVMPWNYQTKYGNLNQIISVQWHLNKEEVIQMLQSTGKNEYVRKRIAWQFEERNIMALVQNFEQSNYKYVKDVTGELIKIQEKENVVQIGIQDFKRNIWFWVLNYLFVERGTMFNKYAFVKSAIKQMANHFNLEYNELLEIIDEAVNRVKNQYFIKTEFISIIQELSKEQLTGRIKSKTTEKQFEYYWELLANQLKNKNLRSSSVKKAEFNDLLINLRNQNEYRFKQLIESLFGNNRHYWEQVLQDLEIKAISEIINVIYKDSNNLCNQINYLESLKLSEILKLSSKALWTTGFMYSREFQYSNKESFLVYFIQKISKKINLKEIDVIDILWTTQITSKQKQVKNLVIHNAIKKAYLERTYLGNKTNSISIISMVDQLYMMLKNSSSDIEFIDKLKESFESLIENKPFEVINVLKGEHSEKFIMVITSLIDEVLVETLIGNTIPSYKKIISAVDTFFKGFEMKSKGERGLYRKSKILLNKILLNTISGGEQSSLFKIFKLFVQDIIRRNSLVKNKGLFFKELLDELKNSSLAFTSQQLFEFENWINELLNVSNIEYIIHDINKKEPQLKVIKLLRELIFTEQKAYVFLEEHSHTIINYFLKNDKEIKDKLVAEYRVKIVNVYTNENSDRASQVLLELFWKCLLRYQEYSGDSIKFKRLFNAGVIKMFPSINKNGLGKKSNIIEYYNNPFFDRSSIENVVDVMFTYLESKNKEDSFIVNKIKHKPEHVVLWTLEMDSSSFYYRIRNSKRAVEIKNKIKKRIEFDQFTQLLLHSSKQSNEVIKYFDGILSLFKICKEFVQSNVMADLFWNELFEIITKSKYSEENFIQFVYSAISKIQKNRTVNSEDIDSVVHNNGIKVNHLLMKVLKKQGSEFKGLLKVTKKPTTGTLKTLDENQLKEVLVYAIEQHHIPYWFNYGNVTSLSLFIKEVVECRPLVLLKILRLKGYSRIKLQEVIHVLDFNQLIRTLINLYPERQRQLSVIEKFYNAIRNVSLKKTPAYQIQNLIAEIVLNAWVSIDWKQIDTISIWNELVWELTTQKRISEEDFFNAFDKIKEHIPVALQLTYESIERNEKTSQKQSLRKEQKLKMESEYKNELTKTIPPEGIPVKNAGMVLINSYFSMLLKRLNLTKDSNFVSEEAQQKAVHYLQYVATGMVNTEEHDLPLNKIFCGIQLHHPIIAGIDISEEETQLINGLIHSCINYWSAIGSCSVNGFRGNWLVRDGLLMEEKERWQLTVEHRPYDVLMLKSPFSFSIIKLPWMKKPLHVTWPF
ncbi:hypothetical protein SAMN04489761_0255 [Tenacibaculum sp. MAR_2009_124]|uniref:contractile injection system tape measure protein n=1 Tax=Tenacibaculum sp. MAR_2009_124 TaxID=1250059 RepID=UPI0008949C2A|nr:contractile injection system tape measure protein [Tenacibaculum sp. MAR_2009_124]SEB37452.1 hypothetical protein SAMN04489761_0255 [Tenacibaculum sp. MAR_2009_124]